MNFPGNCTLHLNEAALCQAIEGAINAARREGEDYVHVTEFARHYSGEYIVTLTTDATPVVSIHAESA